MGVFSGHLWDVFCVFLRGRLVHGSVCIVMVFSSFIPEGFGREVRGVHQAEGGGRSPW